MNEFKSKLFECKAYWDRLGYDGWWYMEVLSITHFRPYVYGTHLVVKSDHKPLSYMYGIWNPSSKLLRTRLDLENYNFTIEYITGKDNVIANALSRIHINDLKLTHENPVTVNTVQTRQQTKNLTKPNQEGTNLKRSEATDRIIYNACNNFNIPKIQFFTTSWN